MVRPLTHHMIHSSGYFQIGLKTEGGMVYVNLETTISNLVTNAVILDSHNTPLSQFVNQTPQLALVNLDQREVQVPGGEKLDIHWTQPQDPESHKISVRLQLAPNLMSEAMVIDFVNITPEKYHKQNNVTIQFQGEGMHISFQSLTQKGEQSALFVDPLKWGLFHQFQSLEYPKPQPLSV